MRSLAAEMKTVLLTGANGLLGQKLVALLQGRRAVDLVATGRGPNRTPLAEGYTYHSLDLTETQSLRNLFETYKFTEVIHCAAMTQVDQCEQEPEACQLHNVEVVRTLVSLCLEHNARLIHISTDFIFDGEESPISETVQPNPVSVYGRAKWEAEQLVTQSGVTAAIVRTSLVYGVVPNMSRSNIVLWVKSNLEASKAINVVDDQWRSPTLAEDLADGVASVLFRNKTGVFNIAGAEYMSVIDIAWRVADFFGLDRKLITPIPSSALSQPAKRPPRTGLVILRAQTELDYHPHNLEAGLAVMDRQLREME
jgi:dTDP-4-dehydrorhamnose reductase